MMFLFLFVVFALVAAACWFQGLWSNVVNLINMTFAGLIATNYYEPMADLCESIDRSFVYLVDSVSFWLLFAITYGILRLITDKLSQTKLEFDFPVEMAGRSILAIATGWLFTCIVAFTIHFSPVAAEPMGSWTSPESKAFLFLAPDRQWMAAAKWYSKGSLSRGVFEPSKVSQGDASWKAQVFDSLNDFRFRHYQRRKNLEDVEGLRVQR